MEANKVKYQTFWKRFWAYSIDSFIIGVFVVLVVVFVGSRSSMFMPVYVIFSIALWLSYRVLFHQLTGQTIGKRVVNIIVLDKDEKQLLSKAQSLRREILPMLTMLVMLYGVYEGSQEKQRELDDLMNLTDSTYSASRIFSHILESQETKFSDILKYCGLAMTAIMNLSVLFDTKSRALHDMMAGSVTIRKEVWERENEDKQLTEKEDHGSHTS